MWGIADILKIPKSVKLLVKIKKHVFYFTEKTIRTFWPTQYVMSEVQSLFGAIGTEATV